MRPRQRPARSPPRRRTSPPQSRTPLIRTRRADRAGARARNAGARVVTAATTPRAARCRSRLTPAPARSVRPARRWLWRSASRRASCSPSRSSPSCAPPSSRSPSHATRASTTTASRRVRPQGEDRTVLGHRSVEPGLAVRTVRVRLPRAHAARAPVHGSPLPRAPSCCFAAGSAFGVLLFPHMVEVLAGFASDQDSSILNAGYYVDFVLKLVVAFGVAFVLPVLLVLLNTLGGPVGAHHPSSVAHRRRHHRRVQCGGHPRRRRAVDVPGRRSHVDAVRRGGAGHIDRRSPRAGRAITPVTPPPRRRPRMFGLTFEKLSSSSHLATVLLGPTRLPGVYAPVRRVRARLRSHVDAASARIETETGVSARRSGARTRSAPVRPEDDHPRGAGGLTHARRCRRLGSEFRRAPCERASDRTRAPAPALAVQLSDEELLRIRPGQRYLVIGGSAHPGASPSTSFRRSSGALAAQPLREADEAITASASESGSATAHAASQAPVLSTSDT